MITINQLLESVDLDFEPRWVTKNEDGHICIWNSTKPEFEDGHWLGSMHIYCAKFKLYEFENKDLQECIYEVPRNTTGNIEKIEVGYNNSLKAQDWQDIAHTVGNKINELIDAVNELKENKGVKNG